MKSTKPFVLGSSIALILIVLIAAAFQVGTAYAATGCFTDTNGHPFETAVCWLKANGIVGGTTFKPNNAATRGTVAQWLYKQSQIPPTTGMILVTPGNSEWRKFSDGDNITMSNFSSATHVTKASAGTAFLSLQPSLPTALYGRSLKLLGVEFCYTSASSAFLSYVEINTFTSTTGAGTRSMRFSDTTNRLDSACRYYVLPTPAILTAKDGANIFIQVQWDVSSQNFIIARTTFVLQPTGIRTIPPSADAADAVILTESTGEGEGPSTSAP